MVDEVVAAFPVFAASALTGHVHIFQYPLRRRGQPYESSRMRLFVTNGSTLRGVDGDGKEATATNDEGVIRATSRLTVRYALDTFGSASFRSEKAETGGENGRHGDDGTGGRNYTYTLISQPFVPRSEYMVACITPEGIHITPVHTVQQLAPDLTSIIGCGQPLPGLSSSSAAQTVGSVRGVPERSHAMTRAAAAVALGAYRVPEAYCTVQASPAVAGLATSNRLQRELYRQRSAALNADAESAVEVRMYVSQARESSMMRRRLLSTTFERASSGQRDERGGRAAAVDAYFPPEILVSGGITGGEAANEAAIIHAFADRQPLMTQIQQLIGRCQVLPLKLILSSVVAPCVAAERRGGGTLGSDVAAPCVVTEVQGVGCLRNCALFLHGVWVARRSARFQGSAAALREVVLVQFYLSPNATVRRGALNALVGGSSVARRMLKEVLHSLATLHSSASGGRVWSLRYVSTDAARREEAVALFTRCFPAEAAAQDELWRRMAQLVRGHLPYLQSGRAPPHLLLGGPLATSGAEGSGGSVGVADTLSAVGGRGQEATNSGVDTRGEGGTNFSDADLGPIRMYIRTLFAEHGVLNKQRAKELVLRGREVHYPAASNAMLSAALQSCVQPFTSSTWVLKSLGEPMVDPHRPLILQAVLQLQTFGIRALQARVQEMLRERGPSAASVGYTVDVTGGDRADADQTSEKVQEEGPPMKVIQRVVSEIAEYKQGERLWHLKSGNAMQ